MLSVVIIVAIGGAYGFSNQSWRSAKSTTKAKADPVRDLTKVEQAACDCTEFQQYYRCIWPNTYCEAGEIGMDYECQNSGEVCTYYKPSPVLYPHYYAPCRNGFYWILY